MIGDRLGTHPPATDAIDRFDHQRHRRVDLAAKLDHRAPEGFRIASPTEHLAGAPQHEREEGREKTEYDERDQEHGLHSASPSAFSPCALGAPR